jgi:signal transduction histidine kinase
VLGANDFAVRMGWMPYSNAYALHFGAPVVMVAMGGLLAARFVSALRQVEIANVELSRKVGEKEYELRHQFERLREVERREASLTERQRIMQDMHDGLGSQLLTSLAAVERGALDPKGMAQVLRDAIDDMRLAIDTLSPGREGLLEALGNLRYRLEPRFRAAGVELRFVYLDVPEQLEVEAAPALQILRVLQESLTNALKHARATQVRVELSLRYDPARLVLAVADDGGGFDPALPGAGRGLSGMRRRARQIGAALEVVSGSRGTCITLSYPLAAAA